MKIKSLHLYPVKSLAGISVDRFELDDFGPRGDRRWVIVDEANRFVTQRQLPILAKVKTELHDDLVRVSFPGGGSFLLEPDGGLQDVVVWRDQVPGRVGASEASAALSRYCGQTLRFVYMPEDSFRRVDPERVSDHRRVSFADGFPLLVTTQSSLMELNGRLESPVDMRRFRPNIVVEGCAPWAEDGWRSLTVSDVSFEVVKPCSRCVMTTVDPDSGLKHPGTQPLKTLAGYRRTPEGVIFGQNAIHQFHGVIRVGDHVTAIYQEN